MRGHRINHRTTIIACALLFASLAAGCGDEPPAAPPTTRGAAPSTPPAAATTPATTAPEIRTAPLPADAPHLILVVLDTVRRDHLSTYGYTRDTAPNLSKAAAGGTLFEQATSTASWTHPAHASMLTGTWPSVHGARYAGVAGSREQQILRPTGDAVLLQDILSRAGYETVAAVGAPVLSQGFGVTAGFQRFAGARPEAEPSAPEVNRNLFRLLDARRGAAPLFALVNYYDAHAPYIARPAQAPWIAPDTATRLVDFAAERDGVARFVRIAAGQEQVSPAERQAAIDNYDSEIARVDLALGELLAGLEERGLRDRAIIAITADHGEYFGEHGLYDHGRTLYREMLDVPLVLLGPRVPGGARVTTPVQIVDLFATFLEAAGQPIPATNRGSSIWPLVEGRDGHRPHPIVSEAYASPGKVGAAPVYSADYRSLFAGGLKLITASPGAAKLFDLAADPAESSDLSHERAPDVSRLSATLDSWPPGHPDAGGRQPPQPTSMSDEERARLRRLGYLD